MHRNSVFFCVRYLFPVNFLVVLWLFCNTAFAASCVPDMTSQYEVIFCELKNRGKLSLAPELVEFRNNPANMQYFLLKRHAQRNRLKIEAPLPEQSENNERADSQVAKVSSKLIQPSVATLPVFERGSTKSGDQKALQNRCRKQKDSLLCENRVYHLQGNRSNTLLKQGVLNDDYKMDLPEFSSAYASSADYLAAAYLRYIERMYDIGLAGVTLSYTKFVHIFVESKKNGSHFSERFETMYRFLKIDKKTIAIREAGNRGSNFALKYCSFLDNRWVTCDNGETNLVFLAK